MRLAVGHNKGGVFHPQWFDQAFFQHHTQRFFAHHFEHATEHVRGQAVFPGAARLPLQRCFRKCFNLLFGCQRDPFGTGFNREQARLCVGLFHGSRTCEFRISQPRGVPQQIVHADATYSGHGGVAVVHRVGQHGLLGKRWQKFRHRVCQLQLTFLHHHHRQHRHHGFGHGVSAKDGVMLDADIVAEHHSTFANHHDHGTGHLFVVDFLLNDCANAFESLCRHAHRRGRRCGQICKHRRQTGQRQQEKNKPRAARQ